MPQTDSSPTTRTALVTGAARGIGLTTARRFLKNGYQVAMLDNDTEQLGLSISEIDQPDKVLSIAANVADPQQVQSAVDAILDRFGAVDALVNNAGIADFMPSGETSYEIWREIMSVNLDGAFLCAQACAKPMLEKRRGAIVNITSISGLRASTLRTAYGTSKAALAHLTRQFAAEWGNAGIRVNSVAPGPINTAMAEKVHDDAIRKAYHDAIPLNRYGLEEEVAAVICFLCSDEASYVNGQQIAVDGGFESTAIGLPALRGEDNPQT